MQKTPSSSSKIDDFSARRSKATTSSASRSRSQVPDSMRTKKRDSDDAGSARGDSDSDLKNRAKYELDFILKHDATSNIKKWYLLECSWLTKWKAFVRGGPLPGPIDNARLLGIDNSPLPGLQKVKHYRGVDAIQWFFWYERYGGGPAIVRSELNIYAAPVAADAFDLGKKSPLSKSASSTSLAPDAKKNAKPSGCDRCDGKHATDKCPFFRKDREKHKDAWVNYGKHNLASRLCEGVEAIVVRNAKVVRQPGDGSCLFHSLAYGLDGMAAQGAPLRRDIARFIESNPNLDVADTPLKEWVNYDDGGTVEQYASRMAKGGWGGGIEMAALSHMKKVNVQVFEKHRDGYKRISVFDSPGTAKKTINVLYQGRMHYDALEIAK